MIVRGVRSPNRKNSTHKYMQTNIQQLTEQNKQLRLDLLRLQQKLLDSEKSKRKYKNKYRQAKQKIQILTLVGSYGHKQTDIHECCLSPRTKQTRIKSSSSDEFHNLKFGIAHSEFDENISTKPYLPENEEYHPKRNLTPATTLREDNSSREDSKMLQNLMKIHEQLDKLSNQIEDKMNNHPIISKLENELYYKMEQVVDKIQKMEVRDLERDKERLSRQKDKSTKKYNSSMKNILKIGEQLRDFKVDS